MNYSSQRTNRPASLASRGIGHVGPKVYDLEKSRKFYHEILSLKDETKGPSTAHVPSGSDILALYETSAGSSTFHFGFLLDSPIQVNEWKEWLKSNNIPIYDDINEEDHPRSIKFRDPDGHWIEIASVS